MSVAAGEPAGGGISPTNVLILGVVGGFAGIYLTLLNRDTTTIFSVFGALGAILAAVWGADAVRRVCSYGLGTGVPSIGMLALGMAVVAAMFGLALPESDLVALPSAAIYLGPVISFVAAVIIGLIIGVLANKVLRMNIPIMERGMMEIAGSGTLVLIGLSIAISGNLDFTASILPNVVNTGYIAVVFIAGAMSLLHPFNACLGPDEKQDRTLYVSVEKGAIAMVLVGIASLTVIDIGSAMLTIVLGLIIWVAAFKRFINATHRDAYLVTGTGLLPTEEELE